MYSFTLRRDSSDLWYWEFTAEGGRGVIATSTPYATKDACIDAIRIIQAQARAARIDNPYDKSS